MARDSIFYGCAGHPPADMDTSADIQESAALYQGTGTTLEYCRDAQTVHDARLPKSALVAICATCMYELKVIPSGLFKCITTTGTTAQEDVLLNAAGDVCYSVTTDGYQHSVSLLKANVAPYYEPGTQLTYTAHDSLRSQCTVIESSLSQWWVACSDSPTWIRLALENALVCRSRFWMSHPATLSAANKLVCTCRPPSYTIKEEESGRMTSTFARNLTPS